MKSRHILSRRHVQGMTVVVVLMLLTVMLLGGLALARMTETGALVFGNVATKDATLQASEVGVNEAFSKLSVAGFSEHTPQAPWYQPVYQATDANGIPLVDFEQMPVIKVGTVLGAPTDGRFEVRYFVERMCNVTPVTDFLQQCLVRMQDSNVANITADAPKIAPANMRQYRITVRVTDKRGTTSWVQSLATVKPN